MEDQRREGLRKGPPISTRARVRGMSLVEIMIAMIIVAIALLALLSLTQSSNRVQDESRERTIAYNAARKMIEEMRSDAVETLYRRYNSNNTDNGLLVCPGAAFEVADLPRGPGGALQGTIIFPEANSGLATARLTENPSDANLATELGMPKDLNRDGDTTDANLLGDSLFPYDILPVKVEVKWVVPGGKINMVQVCTYITAR
jgi:prepilin-type N-terminal cleavage/methylation domain-containing protein